MDDRVYDHAEVLVDWSARIDAGDRVVMRVGEDAHDLAVAVAEKLGERGAVPAVTYGSSEVQRAFLKGAAIGPEARSPGKSEDSRCPDAFEEPDHERSMLERSDVVLSLRGGRNTSAMADVPGEVQRAHATATSEVREARLATDWVSTVHPTRSLAQQAGMAYEEYQDFVYAAVLRDWESLADEMDRMKQILDKGSEVRLVAPGTDVRMSIEGRTAVNSAASVAYDSHNLPSGEVFTAPYDTEGEVTFTVPTTHRGKRVRDVRLVFEDGEVVEYEAGSNPEVIAEILDTDEGARRLGELGIGMNRGIDRFTDNVLFDEKMGDTIHLALGRAYDANLPEGETGNDSAVHVDLITDVSEDSRMEVDGQVVQRNGRFRWEDGFEEATGQ